MNLLPAAAFGGGVYLLYAGMTHPENRDVTPYAEKFAQFGQPWRSGVNPDLGLNRFHYPDRSLVNTYSKHTAAAFSSKGAHDFRKHKLRTSCNSLSQRNNHLVHKRYHNPSQRVTFGHNMPGPSQYAKIGRNQTGQHANVEAVNPRNVLPKKFSESQNRGALSNLYSGQTNVDIHDEERVTGADRHVASTVTGGDLSEQ